MANKFGMGILAIVLVFVIAVIGCDNGNNSGNEGNNDGGNGGNNSSGNGGNGSGTTRHITITGIPTHLNDNVAMLGLFNNALAPIALGEYEAVSGGSVTFLLRTPTGTAIVI